MTTVEIPLINEKVMCQLCNTAENISKYGVFSGLHFAVFGSNMEI